MKRVRTDVLILGAGGAGLFGALHAHRGAPGIEITIAVKGLLGKCGCTRMVQGGYNVALAADDSVERHFLDTVIGGDWLNNQDLAWLLAVNAPNRILELENEIGCLFDRNPDGTLHQKRFAGQTFDRTIHKGDLTGIEIINRLTEQILSRDIKYLEECRAIALIPDSTGKRLSGVFLIDMRNGESLFVQARAVLLATGGGPTMYKYHTPSEDKSCDGLAMALRAGLALRDMEMVQFHPTGLLAGPDTRMTGTVLEEGLRGAGGHLLGGDGARFMQRYDPRGERATRDVVSRAIFEQIRAGNASPSGGVFLRMSHLDHDQIRRQFRGMIRRCADCGFDLVSDQVEVIPSAHYLMGGLEISPSCTTALPGLFAAGEDTGGVHGANRLGGNGVANSTVFGGLAGDSIADYLTNNSEWHEPDKAILEQSESTAYRPFQKSATSLEPARERLFEILWEHVGIVRHAQGLRYADQQLCLLDSELDNMGVDSSTRAYNLAWHDWLNLKNQILISRAITASALARQNSRGAHFRTDFPETDNLKKSTFNRLTLRRANRMKVVSVPVHFNRVAPNENH